MSRLAPLLVTGSHRSGTTFTGRLIAAPSSRGYIHEPFNPVSGVRAVEHWFPYVWNGHPDEDFYADLYRDLIDGRASFERQSVWEANSPKQFVGRLVFGSRKRLQYWLGQWNPAVRAAIIKDPIACLSSEWLHRRFDVPVIVLIRHPAAVVASITRLNWRFDVEKWIREQPGLSDLLRPVIDAQPPPYASAIEEASVLWSCLYFVLHTFLERNPDMMSIKHETICRTPVASFRRMHQYAGYAFEASDAERVRAYTQGSDAPSDHRTVRRDSERVLKKWKHELSGADVATIRRITTRVASAFYDDDAW